MCLLLVPHLYGSLYWLLTISSVRWSKHTPKEIKTVYMHKYSARRKSLHSVSVVVQIDLNQLGMLQTKPGPGMLQTAESYRCDAKLTESATYDANNLQSVKFNGNRWESMSFNGNRTAAARCTADKSDQTTQRLMYAQQAKNMLVFKGWTDLRLPGLWHMEKKAPEMLQTHRKTLRGVGIEKMDNQTDVHTMKHILISKTSLWKCSLLNFIV